MKKVFCILSILTIVSPAFADTTPVVVAGEPTHANSATVAIDAPGYELKTESDTDSTIPVSAKYVKGAYNAAIKAVNKIADSIPVPESDGRAPIWLE